MTTENHPEPPDASPTTTGVPPLSVSPGPVPELGLRIGFAKGVFVSWLRPKRYLPHLSSGSFRRAFAAHMFSVVVTVVIVALALLWDRLRCPVEFPEIRFGLAAVTVEAAQDSARLVAEISAEQWGWPKALLVVACVPVVGELALVLLGTLLMPYAAGGDGALSAWKRSVKNVYWSTAAFMPAALAWALLFLSARWEAHLTVRSYLPCEPKGILGWILTLVGAVLMPCTVVLFLRSLVVGTRRRSGQVADSASSTQLARCDECGYLLRGLSLETKCPECGLPVRDSLEGGRRKTDAWQERELESRGFVLLIHMQWAVLRGSAVFRRIPVQRGIDAARHFWWGTWIFMVVCLLALLRGAAACTDEYAELRLAMGPTSFALILLPLAFQFVMTLAACLWAHMRYGIRNHRISTLVCYYASPLMWPLMLVILAIAIVSTESLTPSLGDWQLNALGVAGTLIAASLAFWWLRLLRALRIVRFASV
jgi:hypothetical protein